MEGNVVPWVGVYATLKEAREAVQREINEKWEDEPDCDAPTLLEEEIHQESWGNPKEKKQGVVTYGDSDGFSTYHFTQHAKFK